MTHLIARFGLQLAMVFSGLLLGLAYFAALKHSVAQLLGGNGWLAPLALTLVRLSIAAGFLYAAVQLGAAPLLAGFAGFLVARALAVRAQRRAH